MKKYLILILIGLGFSSAVFAQQTPNKPLTVNEAVKLTLKNYPLINQLSHQPKIEDLKVEQQKTSFLPDVNADISYSRIGPIPAFNIPGMGAFELAPANNFNANVNLRYNVYDFGRRQAMIDLTKSFKQTAMDNIENVKSGLAIKTITSFYTIIFLNKTIAVKDTLISSLKHHIQITKKRMETGSATDYDVLSTQVKVSNAENEKADLLNAKKKQEIILSALTGIDSDKDLNLQGDFSFSNVSLNKDSLIEAALNNRADYKAALDGEKTAKLKMDAAKHTDLPSVNVNLIYGFKNGYEPNLQALRGNWVAGAGIHFPIFNGNKKDYAIEESKQEIEASKAHSQELLTKIKAEISQAINDLNTSRYKLETTKLQVKFAEESVERARTQYKNGVVTNIEVLDAETALAQARLLYVRELFKNVMNKYMLMNSTGKIL